MPIYEYKCNACEHRFDKLQKISDPVLTDCPECGKPELSKLVSAAGFRLKGGGWYETDFKAKPDPLKTGSSDSSSSTSNSTKSDSKATATTSSNKD